MKFQLYDPDFEVELIRFVTPRAKCEISKLANSLKVKEDSMKVIMEKMLPKLRNIFTDTKVDITNAQDLWQKAIQDGVITNDEILELSEIVMKNDETTSDELIHNDLATLQMFKHLIRTQDLWEEHLKLINSDVTSDFWQAQNLEAINEEVRGFCLKNAIRTRYYQPDTKVGRLGDNRSGFSGTEGEIPEKGT
jgi:hypothetical protein